MKYIKLMGLFIISILFILLISWLAYYYKIDPDVWALISFPIGLSSGLGVFYVGLLIIDGDL